MKGEGEWKILYPLQLLAPLVKMCFSLQSQNLTLNWRLVCLLLAVCYDLVNLGTICYSSSCLELFATISWLIKKIYKKKNRPYSSGMLSGLSNFHMWLRETGHTLVSSFNIPTFICEGQQISALFDLHVLRNGQSEMYVWCMTHSRKKRKSWVTSIFKNKSTFKKNMSKGLIMYIV